ncbi:unnamed protein product [Closterium sp. Naga37s-1]|nr:unnamed protein product [Closterium sp. Naga37s-1]
MSAPHTVATSPSSSEGLAAAVVDAAFAAAEAIATAEAIAAAESIAAGIPVTEGGRALGTLVDVAEDLLVDTSARRDLNEEAGEKGSSRDIPVTETDAELQGIQEDKEEQMAEDEDMEGPVGEMLGDEIGGGSEDVGEERTPAWETPASPANIHATKEAEMSPAAAGEEMQSGSNRAAEPEGIQEEPMVEDEDMEGPVDEMLGDESGGGSEDVGEERSRALETPAIPANDKATTEAEMSPAAAGEEVQGGGNRAAEPEDNLEEPRAEDEAMEGLGGESGGGSKDAGGEQLPALEIPESLANDKAKEAEISPAAAGEDMQDGGNRAGGRWELKSHGKALASKKRGAAEEMQRVKATQQPPSVVLESTEVSVTTAEAVSGSETAATTPSSTRRLPTAIVDAAFAAAEAIAAGVPVTGGGRALGAPADAAEGLPPLVDTSAYRDSSEEARKKGTGVEIAITGTDAEPEERQEDDVEVMEDDEPMEAPADVTLGEEPGTEGGGGEELEEVERSPPLQTPATQGRAAEETKSSPTAAVEEFTGSGGRAAGRWSLRSHGKAAEHEEMRTQEVQEQETRRVKVRMDGNEVTYDINTTAPLRNMFALFCQRLHLPEGGVTFCKDGHVVRGNQTVKDAKLADGSIIEGHYQKYAG